jgi:anti-sigma regulatory factor (Ser/Thr protein kinase)
MSEKLLFSVEVRYANDVVLARQCAHRAAELLGFDEQDQVRISTAVTELVRNAFRYAKGGKVDFSIEGSESPQLFTIGISDHGAGIGNLDEILGGHYESNTGMGLGLIGAQRLMDEFDVKTSTAGTTVVISKILPHVNTLTDSVYENVRAELARLSLQNSLEPTSKTSL